MKLLILITIILKAFDKCEVKDEIGAVVEIAGPTEMKDIVEEDQGNELITGERRPGPRLLKGMVEHDFPPQTESDRMKRLMSFSRGII